MKFIKTGANYNYDGNGLATSVEVKFYGFESPESLNVIVAVSTAEIGGGKTPDDVTPKQIEDIARTKLAGWTAVPVAETETTEETAE